MFCGDGGTTYTVMVCARVLDSWALVFCADKES